MRKSNFFRYWYVIIFFIRCEFLINRKKIFPVRRFGFHQISQCKICVADYIILRSAVGHLRLFPRGGDFATNRDGHRELGFADHRFVGYRNYVSTLNVHESTLLDIVHGRHPTFWVFFRQIGKLYGSIFCRLRRRFVAYLALDEREPVWQIVLGAHKFAVRAHLHTLFSVDACLIA